MARLIKGQIAEGIRRRRDAAQASAAARIDVFLRLSVTSLTDDPDLQKFKTMTSLAGWTDPQRGITPLSARTLRKYVDERYEGGYTRFREQLQQIFSRHDGSMASPPAEGEEERKSRFAADAAMEMTARYVDVLERLRRLSAVSDAASAELARHFRRYGGGAGALRVVK